MQLVEAGTGRVVGTVDASSAHGTVHEGAVYVHQRRDLPGPRRSTSTSTWRSSSAPSPTTPPPRARSPTSAILASASTPAWGPCRLSFGDGRGGAPGGVLPQAPGALGRGARRGAARPARARRCAPRAVWWTVPAARPRGRRAGRPPTCRVPRTPPSTRRSACCRCSRPATAGTSAASRPPCTPTPGSSPSSSTTGTRAARASPSAGYAAARDWLGATREAIARCACDRGLPVLRPVTQVRQRQRPARQGGRGGPARRAARRPLTRGVCVMLRLRSADRADLVVAGAGVLRRVAVCGADVLSGT